jgi:hypothetical protein
MGFLVKRQKDIHNSGMGRRRAAAIPAGAQKRKSSGRPRANEALADKKA